jgi:predicted ATPase/DNA-binding CsgD family transcriptional regulator
MADPTSADRLRPRPIDPILLRGRERLGVSLPVPLTGFVGREREVAAMADLVLRPGVRLVTLIGPGGVGKTRLALRAATDLADAFADGVAFVGLAPLRDPALVEVALAESLGVRDTGSRPLAEGLRAVLEDRELLLVLDNVEPVVDAAPAMADLLIACQRLKILATSRVRLRLSGEQVFPVPPLNLPEAGPDSPFDAVAGAEAVRLFTERARSVDPAFALAPANAPVVAAICARLDGMPLAIELAAARVAHLPLPAVLTRLTRLLPLLADGPRDLPARLRTMRAAIAWSVDLLTEDQRRFFRPLAVFAGGFTPEAAAAVARGSDEPPGDAFAPIAELLDRSLLELDLRGAGPDTAEPRYRMLETIREFAAEELASRGEIEAVRERHAAYYAALADDLGRPREDGRDAAAALERRSIEQDNLRAALAWAAERGESEVGARIVAGMWRFWRMLGRVSEGRAWVARFLPQRAEMSPGPRVWFLVHAGDLELLSGDDVRAVALHDEALALARAIGDDRLVVWASFFRGLAALATGDDATAEARLTEALTIWRGQDSRAGAALVLDNLGTVARMRGDAPRAVASYEEALALSRTIRATWQTAEHLDHLGAVWLESGDTTRALACYRESLGLLRDEGDQCDRRALASSIAGLAYVLATTGQPERAARLCGAAEELTEAIGSRLNVAGRLNLERAFAAIAARLAPNAAAAHHAVGRTMQPEAAIAEGLAAITPPIAEATLPDVGLTPREREVLILLATGATDREIAARLFVSPRTVSTHVTSILRKLGVETRRGARTYALAHGLG